MVVHCKTQEQWDKVAEVNNIKWRGVTWSEHREFSCVRVTPGLYGSFGYYISEGVTVISFEEYMATLNKDGEYKKRYRRIKDNIVGIKTGEVYAEDHIIDKGLGYTVKASVENFPENWEEVFTGDNGSDDVKQKETTTLSLSELGCDLEELGEILKEVGDLEVALEDKLGQAEKLIDKYGLDISMDDYRRNSK